MGTKGKYIRRNQRAPDTDTFGGQPTSRAGMTAHNEEAKAEPCYTETQWSEIERSIAHFKLSSSDRDAIRSRLEMAVDVFIRGDFHNPDREACEKRARQQWAKIEKLSNELRELLAFRSRKETQGGPPSSDCKRAPDRYRDIQAVLLGLTAIAKGRQEAQTVLETMASGKRAPRAWYLYAVLSAWTDVGGALRISRHPLTGRISGPLARYFAAVTQPIIGGSIESLPDIVARQKIRMADLVCRKAGSETADDET